MGFSQALRSVLQRLGLSHDKRDGPFKMGHIVLNDDGFVVMRAGRQRASVNWSDVRTIATLKRDCVVHDSICLGFEVGGGRWVEIREEIEGFMDAGIAMQKQFPSIAEDWYFGVMAEPFAMNFAILWRCDELETSTRSSTEPSR